MATMKVDASLTWAEEAGADLTTSLMLLAKMSSAKKIVLAQANEKCLGVIYEVPLAATSPYGPATVQIGGVAKVITGAAVDAGSRVAADSAGKAVAGTTNPVGVALETSGAAGEVIAVALIG